MILRERPSYYPLHDLLATNTVAVQDTLYRPNGYPSGLPVPSADHNGKLRSNALWNAYGDANQLHIADWVDTTIDAQLTLTSLTYAAGGNVTTTGAIVATRGAYLFQGGRFETDDAFLNQVGAAIQASPLIVPAATLPGRIWIYTNEDGDLRVDSVGVGVADSPNPDELSLVGVDVDAGGVVTDGAVTPTTAPLPPSVLPVSIEIDSAGDITARNLNADAIVTGLRFVALGGLLGGPTLSVGATSGQTSVDVTGDGTLAAITSAGGTSYALIGTSSGSDACLRATHTGSGAGLLLAHSGSGQGLNINQFGTGVGIRVNATSDYAIDATGPSGGDVINSTTDSGIAVRAVVTSTGVGVAAIGGPSASSVPVYGVTGHVDAIGVQGETIGGANTAAAGVQGLGNGAGTGVYALANGTGYGAVLEADTTTPARAAVRLIPQDADPTTGDQGALLLNSARGPTGKLRTYTTQWESVHSSAKGYVFVFGTAASGVTAGGSGNLSLAQISPEETGDVLVTGTGHLEFSVDNGSCTVALWDVTAAVLIAAQIETSSDPANNAVNLGIIQRSFAIRSPYTLPDANTRTFAVVITANTGTITFEHVVTSVDGVQ
jgi:hypothetical protein